MSSPFHTLPIASGKETRTSARRIFFSPPYAKLLTSSLLADTLVVIARLLPAQIAGWSIDQLREGHLNHTRQLIIYWLLASSILIFIGICISSSKYFLVSKFARDLRVKFINSALHIPPYIIERAGTGDLLSRDTSDMEKIVSTIDNLVNQLISYFFYLIIILILAFISSPLLALAMLAGIILFCPALRWYIPRSRKAYIRESSANGDIYSQMAASIAGAHTIEAFSLGAERRDALYYSMRTHLRASLFTISQRKFFTIAVEFGLFLPLFAWIVFSYIGYSHAWFTVGVIITIGMYIVDLASPIDSILTWLDQLQSAYASYSRIVGVDLIESPIYPDPVLLPRDNELVLRAVDFYYPQAHKAALSHISLTIKPGERIAIVGPSGAGKSTLAKLISGCDFPTSGTVTIGGIALSDIPLSILRTYIYFITQEHHIFIGTIADNVRMAQATATEEEIRTALTTVEAEWAFQLGLDTPVGDGRYELSTDQVQQIALARVILANPAIVVLDEATSLLDPRSAQTAEQGLINFLGDKTIITIAHRLYSAQTADRIIVMEHGTITEQGNHTELLALNGIYTQLWSAWNN